MAAAPGILAAGLIMTIFAAPAWARQPCEPLNPGDVHELVDAILSAPNLAEEFRRIDQLNDALSVCERPELMSSGVANDLTRLLDRPELLPYVVRIFDRMGRAARPARRRIHQAYLAERRAAQTNLEELRRTGVGFTTGPGHASLRALRCLDIWLGTGRRIRKYCRYLDY